MKPIRIFLWKQKKFTFLYVIIFFLEHVHFFVFYFFQNQFTVPCLAQKQNFEKFRTGMYRSSKDRNNSNKQDVKL